MAVNKITVTGNLGPGISETSVVYNNVSSVNFQIDRQVVQIYYLEDSSQNQRHVEFNLYGTTTVTYSISGHIATIAMSQ